MKYFIISDTHFNHVEKMCKWCGRPKDYEKKLWKALDDLPDDCTLIHLGDVCIGNDERVHNRMGTLRYKKILVKGNHDKKSNTWYLNKGWDFVCEQFSDTIYGKRVLFSHKPAKFDGKYEINVHGHFHNTTHRSQEPELVEIYNELQKLYACEYEKYTPVSLESFINR